MSNQVVVYFCPLFSGIIILAHERQRHEVALGLYRHQTRNRILHRLRSAELCKVRLEAHDAGVGVRVVLDVIVLHVLVGFVQVARAENHAEEVVGQLFVGGQLGVLALEQRGLIGSRHHRKGGKYRRGEQSERKSATKSSHIGHPLYHNLRGVDMRIRMP